MSEYSGERLVIDPERAANPQELLSQVGINPEAVEPKVIERLERLQHHPHMLSDARHMLRDVEKIFEYAEFSKQKAFGYDEKQAVRAAIVLADIGKSGPPDASIEVQELCVKIYGVENIEIADKRDPEYISLQEFMVKYLSNNDISSLQHYDPRVIPGMTMREFYNLHAQWSASILKSSDAIPPEAKQASARHHALEGVNAPDTLTTVDQLVILLDKYDATRRRMGKDHPKIMLLLQKHIEKPSSHYTVQQFATLLSYLDEALK